MNVAQAVQLLASLSPAEQALPLVVWHAGTLTEIRAFKLREARHTDNGRACVQALQFTPAALVREYLSPAATREVAP